MQPKVIKSDAEHTAALARLDELMAADPAPGTRELDELELLSLLVERYEEERFPLGLPDPVEAIRVRMQEEGLRPRDLAPYLGGANKVSEVLARKRPLTLKMIRALHEGLGISRPKYCCGSQMDACRTAATSRWADSRGRRWPSVAG